MYHMYTLEAPNVAVVHSVGLAMGVGDGWFYLTTLPPIQSRFSQVECELYVKQPLRPTPHKIIVAYCSVYDRLAIETRRWSTIPIPEENKLCHFCSYTVIESKAHFVLECPMYNPLRANFPSVFEKCSVRN